LQESFRGVIESTRGSSSELKVEDERKRSWKVNGVSEDRLLTEPRQQLNVSNRVFKPLVA
ncbi:hypothetical protein AMECASPLE_038273, partial [Ameca splendens]